MFGRLTGFSLIYPTARAYFCPQKEISMKTMVKTAARMAISLLMLSFVVFAGCENDADTDLPKPRRFSDTMQIDGRQRSLIINLPPRYDTGTAGLPLIIGLHGTGGNAAQFERNYHFSEKADEAGFIAVYPNGIQSEGRLGIRTWNAGACCDYAMEQNVNDVKFISGLIDKMIAEYHVDPKRVYVTGMSNGGMMAYRLAAEIPGKIAAIAPVSCTMVFDPPGGSSRPVPIIHIHSILDKIIPYAGTTNPLGYHFPPVDSVLSVWVRRNGCRPEAQVLVDNSEYKQMQWLDASGNPMIVHYVTQDGGHSWPGGDQVRPGAAPPSRVLDANDLIWAFFRQYALP